jgi:hypothetical protein
MQKLKPGEKKMVVDTFKVNSDLRSNPIVEMQGYKPGSSDSYKELYAKYTLLPKYKLIKKM